MKLKESPRATARGTTGFRTRRRAAVAVGAVGFLASGLLQHPASAAEPTVFATGVTGPASILRLGDATNGYTTWVADHMQGFCRLDGSSLNPTTCVNGESAPGGAPVSPGQGSYDPATDWVYLPDNSAASEGVYRLSYDPVAKTVTGGGLMGGGLAGIRTSSTTLIGDTLFVGGLRSNTVYRLDTTNVLAPAAAHGVTSDGGGVESLTSNGNMLYLAEGEGVAALSATVGGTASLVVNPAIEAPGLVASDGTHLYVVAIDELTGAGELLRWHHTTGVTDLFSDDGGTFPSSIGFAPGDVYVGDDPSEGAFIGQGRILRYGSADAPEEAALATVPLPAEGSGTGGDETTPPPPPADGTTIATIVDAEAPLNPRGFVRLGSHLWVADASRGFCKVVPDGALADCHTGVTQVGQPSVTTVGSTTYVLLPHSAGVRRLTYSAATATVGSPAALGGGRLTDAMTTTALSGDGSSVYAAGPGASLVKASVTNTGARPTEVAELAAGAVGMARSNGNLYIAQSAAVRVVSNVDSCTGKCTDSATAVSISNPSAIASNGGDLVFLASGDVMQRFDLSTGIDPRYVATYYTDSTNTTKAGFTSLTGAVVDGTNLVLGDTKGVYTTPQS